jgi:hypothetical protein
MGFIGSWALALVNWSIKDSGDMQILSHRPGKVEHGEGASLSDSSWIYWENVKALT